MKESNARGRAGTPDLILSKRIDSGKFSRALPEKHTPNSRLSRKAKALLIAQAKGKQLHNQQRRIVQRWQRQQRREIA
ncbi:MAG: hypothetical protein F6K04_02325 [Leptolyngbya sp. SIO4C5]|nr:hypothetical protein [Leptolyngbya sp. SIO4C5]